MQLYVRVGLSGGNLHIFYLQGASWPPELIYSTHLNIMERREGGEISNAVPALPSTRLAGLLGNNISLIVMFDVCDVVTDM